MVNTHEKLGFASTGILFKCTGGAVDPTHIKMIFASAKVKIKFMQHNGIHPVNNLSE